MPPAPPHTYNIYSDIYLRLFHIYCWRRKNYWNHNWTARNMSSMHHFCKKRSSKKGFISMTFPAMHLKFIQCITEIYLKLKQMWQKYSSYTAIDSQKKILGLFHLWLYVAWGEVANHNLCMVTWKTAVEANMYPMS